jgi:3-oxoacyl-[acyl-carrier-protein] synthase-3
MAGGKVEGVEVIGIAAAVPQTLRTLADTEKVFGEEQARWTAKNTGIIQTCIAPMGICASDMCYVAGEKLLQEVGWERSSVDVLVFVSVTPDYRAPATACTLQHRLKLGKNCAAFDISLGCSGYIYGLWVVANILSSASAKRALLLVGDTMTRLASPLDRTTFPLAGDAGTATAVQRSDIAAPMYFQLGSDGAGAEHIMMRGGGFRHPSTTETRERVAIDTGIVRSDEDMAVNGLETCAFACREVPPLAAAIMDMAGWTVEDVDAIVMPQASLFVMQYLARKLQIPKAKVIENLTNFGDTGGSTIPLALSEKFAEPLRRDRQNVVLIGVGTGYSWGGLALKCGPIAIPGLTVVGEQTPLARI